VIAIHAAFAVAVHVQSRLVEIASVPDIPSAGAAPFAAFSTVTSHLAAVGAVTDMAEDDPVHALERHPSAHSTNSRARIPRVQMQAVCRAPFACRIAQQFPRPPADAGGRTRLTGGGQVRPHAKQSRRATRGVREHEIARQGARSQRRSTRVIEVPSNSSR